MKLNIRELVIEANNKASENMNNNPKTHEGFDRERMKSFARLIVERCAVECDKRDDPYVQSIQALMCAEAIRNLMEDK